MVISSVNGEAVEVEKSPYVYLAQTQPRAVGEDIILPRETGGFAKTPPLLVILSGRHGAPRARGKRVHAF